MITRVLLIILLLAANALGQSVFNSYRNTVAPLLLEALPSETDPEARGAMGRVERGRESVA